MFLTRWGYYKTGRKEIAQAPLTNAAVGGGLALIMWWLTSVEKSWSDVSTAAGAVVRVVPLTRPKAVESEFGLLGR